MFLYWAQYAIGVVNLLRHDQPSWDRMSRTPWPDEAAAHNVAGFRMELRPVLILPNGDVLIDLTDLLALAIELETARNGIHRPDLLEPYA